MAVQHERGSHATNWIGKLSKIGGRALAERSGTFYN
jgi:hypothetical protein